MKRKSCSYLRRVGICAAHFFAVGTVFVFPILLWATTVKKMDLDELVAHSGRIVIGRCLSVESRWNEKKTLILTYSEFEVEQDLKGDSPSVITVVTIGGKVGDRVQAVAGMPSFSAGQESLLFLEKQKEQYWLPVGLQQGHFGIFLNSRTGVREASRSLRGLEIIAPTGSASTAVTASDRMPLDRLVTAIKASLARQRSE